MDLTANASSQAPRRPKPESHTTPKTSAQTVVDPPNAANIDVDATVRGGQVMVRRSLFVYGFTGLLLILANLITDQISDPLFLHISFTQAAPVLAVSATVAIGLHVAVYNLTHEKPDASIGPDILARLDAFSTGGLMVAIASAAAGLLMLWPADPKMPDGLDVLGALLSVVVVLVAGMAGHIVPASAMATLDRARELYKKAWLDRTANYWRVEKPPTAVGALLLVVLCVLPTILISLTVRGFTGASFVFGLVWSGVVLAPSILTFVGLVLLLHRWHGSAVLAIAAGLLLALGLLIVMGIEASSDPSALAFLLAAVLGWTVLGSSLLPSPAGGRRHYVPRLLRHFATRSLDLRLGWMSRPARQRTSSRRAALVAWFRRATGRADDKATVKG